MNLTEEEREVIRRMRRSPRAHTAIYKYAIAFEGDDQAVTPGRMTDAYERTFD